MMQFSNPIPVIIEENKEGYALYVRDGGTFENDIWCVNIQQEKVIHTVE
jgi:hypothetical protein